MNVDQTLIPDLITNRRVLKPWWNIEKKEVSNKLLLHTLGDYQNSHSSSSNGTFQNVESNSWFSIKKWIPAEKSEISSLPSQSFRVESIENTSDEPLVGKPERTRVSSKAKTKETAVNSSRKIRLYPNKEQENHLRNMFGFYRKTWNLALKWN